MQSKTVRHRHNSYIAQSGRCYYCDCLMWENNPEHFARSNNISLPQARWLQCTAEHLVARKDGGGDAAENIVAACRWCNFKRHSRKLSLGPQEFLRYVKQRIRKGRWHCKEILLHLFYDDRGEHASSY